MKDLHVGVVPYFEDYNVKENENRELIRDLLKLSDKTLRAIGRKGMTSEGRKVAEHYVAGGDINGPVDSLGNFCFDLRPTHYHIAKPMILVNGIEVPAPVSGEPEMGQEYYVPDSSGEFCTTNYRWDDDDHDRAMFAKHLVYLDHDDCVKRAKAMLKFEVIE